MTPCGQKLTEDFPEVTEEMAEEILQQARNRAVERAKKNGGNLDRALKEITEEMQQRDKIRSANAKRGMYLNKDAEMKFLDYVMRFPAAGSTVGEGIKARLVGGADNVPGARYSVGAQMKAENHGYFGRIIEAFEQDPAVYHAFVHNTLAKEFYIEMGEIKPEGKPGSSGSPIAQKMAEVIDKVTKEMNARLNEAGAIVYNLPGYVMRQTHDMFKIRQAGKTKAESRIAWKNFVRPLLDDELTYLGADKEKFLNMVHDDLYSGVTGVMGVEGQGVGHRAISDRWSTERVLHFKDAISAYEYNEKFGTHDIKQQIMTDIGNRARSIALMENLGPNPEATVLNVVRKAKEWARTQDNAAELVDSINDHAIMAYYHQLTGVQDIPNNPSLARMAGNVRAVTQMARMGGVALTNLFTDTAFMHPEMAFQGISHLNTLGKQIRMFAKETKEERKTLRLMGVGLDGLLGNALSRYSATGPISGPINKFQKTFFDINFSNYVTDTVKSAAAELMSANLGEHADIAFKDLPMELNRVLSLYEIGPKEWDLLRSTAYDHPSGNWGKLITADQISRLTDEQIATLGEGEMTPQKLIKLRNRLDTQLRTYISDRVDYSSPTPGHAEHAITTMDTKSGTGLGEAIRLLMLFKSFPVTVANKVLKREIYGRGSMNVKDWAMNDHKGKFNLAQLIAMTTAAGYIGMTIRDALKGRTPRELITDGKINYDVLGDAAVQGGGMGIMGEMVTRDYGQGMNSFLQSAAGPVLSQLDEVARIKTKALEGDPVGAQLGKMAMDNTPLLNLFYTRPILNYIVLWNMQEMMNPGSLERMENTVEEKNNQSFFYRPSEHVK
jgi:ElaB/YqjD/DUF883 family membrane-anchored ribosome-binding protein